jgi:integrase
VGTYPDSGVLVQRPQGRRSGLAGPKAQSVRNLFDSGAELPVIQTLLGHADPRDTMIYLHLATRKLREAPNPLEMLNLPSAQGREPVA